MADKKSNNGKGKYIPMKMLDGCGGAWGNPTRANPTTTTWRCTKCGQVHK